MPVESARSGEGALHEYVSASVLSGAAGFADALGYLASGVFAANMTGNTVLGAMSLAQGHFALAAERFCTLIAFFAGAMLARAVLHWRRSSVSAALGVEAMILLLGAWGGVHSFVGLQIVAVAMGVQAAAMTRFAGVQVSTVVITSTLARLAESAMDRLAGRLGSSLGPNTTNVRLLAMTWVFYAAGAAVAVGLLTTIGPEHALVVPAVAVLMVAGLVRQRRDRAT